MPNLLHLLQTEYDALILELFDTRQALEQTRKELSQSLYQNDAAVRVIARLAMERDEARQQLVLQQQTVVSGTTDDPNQPATKKQKTSTTTEESATGGESDDLM
eukprot:CAMPEP_0194045120 /NCGR_PEP_ID=MMETSP0009_2-20130614/16493_1 /TAXON_ID=210454 /ORGANISM="Grammatophora oceanica, Strain CCMP 410" /LENGTH=103 /DNA_ID=CAMNT_0038689877 /DNA_START=27 /DNA_END=335 /DNA_ORIENTATION=+